MPPTSDLKTNYAQAANRSIDIGDTVLAYRDLGPREDVPIIMLNHWGAVLDNFDPRIVDGLASRHRVITVDYRGMGASGGRAPVTIDVMSRDIISLIRALSLTQVDLFGFSLGGFVAQDVALKAPSLVRKLILAGTGPAGGGQGHDQSGVIARHMIMGLLTFRDPKYYLFFPGTATGRRAANDFLSRLKERQSGRDKGPAFGAFIRQTRAIKAWGRQSPQDLSRIRSPALVVNGDNDTMVPTALSHDLVRRLPHAELLIYTDSGHGGIFQYHADFVQKALAFLDKQHQDQRV